MAIDLDYSKEGNRDLFSTKAEEYAKKIGKDVKNTQIRLFYDYVLLYAEKAKRMEDEEFKSDVLPFVRMMKSKVAYASARKANGKNIINPEFETMMNDCIDAVQDKKSLNNFKLFFEAVIGFHKVINSK